MPSSEAREWMPSLHIGAALQHAGGQGRMAPAVWDEDAEDAQDAQDAEDAASRRGALVSAPPALSPPSIVCLSVSFCVCVRDKQGRGGLQSRCAGSRGEERACNAWQATCCVWKHQGTACRDTEAGTECRDTEAACVETPRQALRVETPRQRV